ncbi:MAG: DUF4442 domain-containing protein [Flammeovirgaceae bacterium]
MENTPNKLTRALKRVEAYPKFMQAWLIDKAIGNAVKLVGTSQIHFEELGHAKLVASLKNRKKIRNHIGQIHAAAMILLAETATGILVGMNIPDSKVPLIKTLNTNFVRRTLGDMKAVATLTNAQIEQIHTTDKGETWVAVTVTDETGEEVIECKALWAWRLKDKR